MSSFTALRAQRQSKTTKSCASVPTTSSSAHPSVNDSVLGSIEPSGAETRNERPKDVNGLVADSPGAPNPISGAVEKGDLYACLPSTLQMRISPASGRGVYASKGLAPGALPRPLLYPLLAHV